MSQLKEDFLRCANAPSRQRSGVAFIAVLALVLVVPLLSSTHVFKQRRPSSAGAELATEPVIGKGAGEKTSKVLLKARAYKAVDANTGCSGDLVRDKESLVLVDHFIAENKAPARAYLRAAQFSIQLRQLARARRYVEDGLQIAKSSDEAMLLKFECAKVCEYEGNLPGAVKLLQEILPDANSNLRVLILNQICRLNLDSGQLKEALQCLAQLKKESSSDEQQRLSIAINQCRALIMMNKLNEFDKQFVETVDLVGAMPPLTQYHILDPIYLSLQECRLYSNQAMTFIQSLASKADSKTQPIILLRIYTYQYYCGADEEAIAKCCRLVLRAEKDGQSEQSAHLRYCTAQLMMHSNKIKEAKDVMLPVLSNRHAEPAVQHFALQVACRYANRELSRAEELQFFQSLAKLAEGSSVHSPALLGLAQAGVRSGNYSLALECAELAKQKSSNDDSIWFAANSLIASILIQQGQSEKAIPGLELALRRGIRMVEAGVDSKFADNVAASALQLARCYDGLRLIERQSKMLRSVAEVANRFSALEQSNFFRTAALYCQGEPLVAREYLKRSRNAAKLVSSANLRRQQELKTRRAEIQCQSCTPEQKDLAFKQLIKDWQALPEPDFNEMCSVCADASALPTGSPTQVAQWTTLGMAFAKQTQVGDDYLMTWLQSQGLRAFRNNEDGCAKELFAKALAIPAQSQSTKLRRARLLEQYASALMKRGLDAGDYLQQAAALRNELKIMAVHTSRQ